MKQHHLCERCRVCLLYTDAQDLGDQEQYVPPGSGFNHHRTWNSFDNALRNFCVLCNYLWSSWSSSPVAADFATTWQWSSRKPGVLWIRFLLRDRETIYISLQVIDNRLAQARYQEDLIPDHTSDDAVLDEASSWLKYCAANHKLCAAHYAADTWYPTQLIDLISTEHSPESTWRLVEKPSAPEIQGGYVTLSHRWGSGASEPFKLTHSTREAMRKGLPDSCLHGTYRDAMRVTRKLGLRYIWIDSLCIPQDPGSLNIQVEAHRMAEVYGHSFCNISTLTARQDTIFVSREPELYSPSKIVIPGDVYNLQRSYGIWLGNLWQDSVLKTPLTHRGWILQEQLLPKRVLYFGGNQVLWSCLQGGFCESYPLDDRTTSWLKDGLFQGDTAPLRSALSYAVNQNLVSKGKAAPVMPDDKDGRVMDWMDILILYGQRQLTMPGDKLLAIAGLGQLLSTMLNDRLIGGLFVSKLPANLLWTMDHLTARKTGYGLIKKSSVTRAPSWSWAYYDGPIAEYSGLGLSAPGFSRAVSRVIDIETEIDVIEDIEIVRGGALLLFGAHLPFELRISNTGDGEQSSNVWFIPFEPLSSTSSPSHATKSQKGLTLAVGGVYDYDEPEWGDEEEDGRVLFDLIEYQSLNTQLTAVFVTSQVSFANADQTQYMYRFDGLVLRRHPLYQKDNIWERVGMFVVTLYTDCKTRPDTPMTKDWNFDEFEMDEEGDASYPTYNFDDERVAGYMQTFKIM